MSDEGAITPNNVASKAAENKQGFTPITTQEELDKIVSSRLNREREKFADYEEVKAKAEQLAEVTEAAETAKAEAEALRGELETARGESLKQRVATEFGVPVNLISGADEDSLKASAQALKEYAEANKAPVGAVVKSVGSDTGDASGDIHTDEGARALLDAL